MRREEAEKYRLQAKLPVYRRRVQRAQALVREALARRAGLWCVCVSGGKDSTALAYLAVEAGWDGVLLHFYYRETPAENTALCCALARELGKPIITVPVMGAFDVYDQAGRFFVTPETVQEQRLVNLMHKTYKRQAEASAAENGIVGQFWGMRKQESKYRAITLNRYGATYQSKARSTLTSCPLADWSGADVWAYLLEHDAKWLGVYDAAEDRERERSELTWLWSDQLWATGMGQRFRAAFPAQWAELTAKYPQLREIQ